MGFADSTTRRLLAACLMLLLVACSRGDEPEVPRSASERLLAEYGLDPDSAIDLPSGSRVIFFGDSITVGGTNEQGYVTLVDEALDTLYPGRNIEILASGVTGDQASDLVSRVQRGVLAKDPTHVVIYVGVNDVAAIAVGRANLEAGAGRYRQQLAGLVETITESGAEVMLCTPAVIGEDVEQGTLNNYGLELYAAEVRELAQEMSTGLCDLRSAFTEQLAGDGSAARSGTLTVDGIHLNPAGNRLVARTILRAFSGSGPTPSPFVVPTVSPRPQPSRTRPAPVARPAAPPPSAPTPPAESPVPAPPTPPAPPSPEPSPSAAPVQTPDGFPFESPSAEPTPPE